MITIIIKKIPWPESASELYRPNDRRSLAKLVPTFAVRWCYVVSVTDPYSRIIGSLDCIIIIIKMIIIITII
jgi:hypothetical protein